MAVDYTAVFGMLGKLVKAVNGITPYYAELDTLRSGIETEFSSESRFDLLADVPANWDGYKSNVLGWVQSINAKAAQLLTHRDLLLEQLPVGSGSSLQEVMTALIADMLANSQNIDVNTVTVSSVTTSSTNASVGELIVDTTLDGVSSPGNGFPASEGYYNLTSELADDDTIIVKCVQDSETGTEEGHEAFIWYGKPTRPAPYHWQDYGTGTAVQITPLNSYTYVTNGEFEDFTSNVPDNWTLNYGTAGSHVFEETSVVKRGTSCLKFTGDGAQATIQVSQSLASVVGRLVPLKRYCLAFWMRGTSGTAAGSFTAQLEGTGYTPGASETLTLNAAALAALTGWVRKAVHITMPREIPDDLKLVLKVTGTLTNAKSVYVDGLAFGDVVYCGGVNVAILAGEDKFLRGDTFTFTTANDDAGVFQTWFRKAFGYQLPSDATPTISDTLAT